MKHTNSSSQRASSPGWQLLGELKLTVNPDADRTVDKWLAVILSRLDLSADFMNRVLTSAQEAITRTMQLEGSARFEHLHLLVFVTDDLTSKRQSRGFFRIEKVETGGANPHPDHTIELYLYPEGG